MKVATTEAFGELLKWCREREFAGFDPFDALNSRVFQSFPLRSSRIARLILTQVNKRSWFNLRPLLQIPAQPNSKGIALFALAALSNYRRVQTIEAETEARDLLDRLWEMRIEGYAGAGWGYNFAWQSRNFYAPLGTPMIVPTAFAARALTDAYETFADAEYLKRARNVCEFILKDLKRTHETEDEICFSYSPLDDTQIFNATLLAAETLATVGMLNNDPALSNPAASATRYVVRRQNDDGSWFYGTESGQQWIDSFHTAYVLQSLGRIVDTENHRNAEFKQALERGYGFWRERFFLADGWPKYYHDSLYPADTHAAATAIVTFIELQQMDDGAVPLAEKIAAWTIRHLRDSRGFFYYQRRRFHTIHTPFMRWSQAWMLYALARLQEQNS